MALRRIEVPPFRRAIGTPPAGASTASAIVGLLAHVGPALSELTLLPRKG